MQQFPGATPDPSPADACEADLSLSGHIAGAADVTKSADDRGSRYRKGMWIAATAAWLIAVGVGTFMLLDYSKTTGVAGTAPEMLPVASQIKVDGAKPTLVMFAHPQCPCSSASVAELDRLIARTGQGLQAHVFFILPEGMDESWCKGSLWRRAAAIPGVKVALDRDGFEAQLYGAMTSGQCVLYGTDGKLLFQGGITAARGHEGDNVGAETVRSLLKDRASSVAVAPVFGCELCKEGEGQ